LAALEHQWQVATCLLADSAEWPAAEGMEAELIRSGADCYRGVSEVLERTGGFVWSVVKQGQPLLLHLESLGDEATPSVMRVLESAAAFSPAFRPVRFGEVGVRFTERERTLLQLLPSHLSYAEIAAELYLSVNTVKSNLKTLYRKLGVSSRSEAVRRARAAKLG
jgi:DNA-binding CsgD family transcriptional regulator